MLNAERLDGSSQAALTPHKAKAKMQLDCSTMTTDKLRRCKHINNLRLKYFTLNFSFSPLCPQTASHFGHVASFHCKPPAPFQSYLSNEA